MKLVTTNACRANQLLHYIKTGLKLVVVGGDTPWSVEGNPPEPDVTLFNIPQPLAYFPVSRLSVVVDHPQGNIYIPDGTRYYQIVPSTVEQVATANPAGVLVEAQIPHAILGQIGVASYRMAGLLNDCVIDQAIYSPMQLIQPTEVRSFVLELVAYFPPVYIRPQGVHLVRFLRRF